MPSREKPIGGMPTNMESVPASRGSVVNSRVPGVSGVGVGLGYDEAWSRS